MARQPCDVFISYSAESGADEAGRLKGRICELGLTPFAYQYTLNAGQPWQQEVLDALKACRCVLVLVPSDDKAVTDYMNHEIGIAHLLDKQIVPIALNRDFRLAAPMSGMVSQYWGRPLEDILPDIESMFDRLGVYSAARRTSLWSHYLVSDSTRLVQGGIDPRKLDNPEQGLAGHHVSIGVSRAVTRLLCVFAQEFAMDSSEKHLIAQDLTDSEVARHDLVVLGGPHSLHESPFARYHERAGILFDETLRAYRAGQSSHIVGSNPERDGFTQQGCVLAFLQNPMNTKREIMLVSGVSGFGCQGAVEYLAGEDLCEGLVEDVKCWRADGRKLPLLFEIRAKFKGATYVGGSANASRIDSATAT